VRENPFRNVLLLIAVVGTIVGALLIANAPVLIPSGEFFDPFTVMGQFIWGLGTLGSGITAFLLWMAVSAIGWAVEHPSSSAADEKAG
jgi:hypothetical protein